MAEEVKEVSKDTTQGEETKAPEGTVEAQIQKDSPTGEEKKGEDKHQETVPLSVFLSLKSDFKELQKEIRESKNSEKQGIITEGIKDLAEKYPDVDKSFIKDILEASTAKAVKELDDKYNSVFKEQEVKEQRRKFNEAFDKVFDKALADNPDLPKTIDKEVVKSLALTPEYKNTPISEILVKLYGGVAEKGKSSSENDTRTAGDIVDETIDFGKMTESQKRAVMADSKTRTKYFAWLDKQ